jgi:acyl carrier protein
MQALEEELKHLLIEALNLEDVQASEIDPNAPLFVDGLGLDSIDALEIGVALQKRYGVMLTDSESARRHFGSVRNLAQFVAANRLR